jgi:AraC-like DNA-binding protein
LDNFKELIQKEFSNADLSIENLCEEIGLSRSQLYKKVMALTGSSPVDYIQELRIREAMHLLKSTALSVSEIAFRVGYNDSRYFSNRFKKFTNSTPGEFRNKS